MKKDKIEQILWRKVIMIEFWRIPKFECQRKRERRSNKKSHKVVACQKGCIHVLLSMVYDLVILPYSD
jgi:hypothetical protein